jgi:hypothetical protein
MSAPFRVLFRWAREALDALGEAIPDKAVVIFNRLTSQWEVRSLQPEDVGAAPAAHTHPLATSTQHAFMSAQDKTKLDGLAAPRPAFREVAVGSTVIPSVDGGERLTLVAGPNVTLVPDASNRRVVISSTGGGGSGGGGGGGYASVIAGSEVLTADNGEPLLIQGSGPITVSGDAATDTVTLGLAMGPGSGLDADTLDGAQASDFAPAAHTHPDYSPVGHNHDGVYAPLAHTHPVATASSAGFMSAQDKSKLDGVQAGAEVNQMAYSAVKVGETTVAAQSKTDTLELVAGPNVTLVPDTTARKVTISASGGSNSPSFSKVRVGTTDIEAAVPGDTVTVEGLGEVSATADTVNKKVQLYVPARPAFSRVRVGATEVQAAGPQDVVELAAGSGVTLTPDATNKRVTVAAVQSPDFGAVKVGATTLTAPAQGATLELAAGSNIALTPNAANNRVTIAVSPQGSGSGLAADTLDGYHAGNASGQVPVSNGTVNTNLNADMVDGQHASAFVTSSFTHATASTTSSSPGAISGTSYTTLRSITIPTPGTWLVLGYVVIQNQDNVAGSQGLTMRIDGSTVHNRSLYKSGSSTESYPITVFQLVTTTTSNESVVWDAQASADNKLYAYDARLVAIKLNHN